MIAVMCLQFTYLDHAAHHFYVQLSTHEEHELLSQTAQDVDWDFQDEVRAGSEYLFLLPWSYQHLQGKQGTLFMVIAWLMLVGCQ